MDDSLFLQAGQQLIDSFDNLDSLPIDLVAVAYPLSIILIFVAAAETAITHSPSVATVQQVNWFCQQNVA
jgi:hypothetical protein